MGPIHPVWGHTDAGKVLISRHGGDGKASPQAKPLWRCAVWLQRQQWQPNNRKNMTPAHDPKPGK